MDSKAKATAKAMTRKDFFTLTFTLVGGAVVAAGCSSTSNPADGGGSGGNAGGGTGGSGSGGSSGNDAAADVHADTRPDIGTDRGPGDTGISCATPLPAVQTADATGHMHFLMIDAASLAVPTMQTFLTGPFPLDSSGAHFHEVILSPANLAMLKGGGSVMVTSESGGTPAHTHVYMISCH